ncbi:bifunctional transcriptional activator/DNA repair enzyme AdaA [Bordetella sp. H567]|uniref:bifunctional transcriptional activator/DNA repair enzyme AdaA n=1 Tax=Bordetella sp. H567 TaxID=1697043 RepID=UPI00082E2F40|nr:methylated-DNA--[protein]-cysteine S-methyltransferase [Bordetella sp. H567]
MNHPAPPVHPHAALVEQACRAMESGEAMDLAALAEQAGMSRFHFHRVFKAVTGITPKAYAKAVRASRARKELDHGRSVTDAIYEAGFNSSGRFYESMPAMLGMTPTEFRRRGAGVRIRFAVAQCSLGALLVAATDKGICQIALDDDPQALVKNLQDRFALATLEGGDEEFEQWVAQVVGFVENPGLGLSLPLDVRGTAFQQRVWEALRDIPMGSTASYADIARRIGAPTAVRAVARACATNAIALAIPCHRVVRTDGLPAGYRWGIARKAELLKREDQANKA